MNSVVIIDDHEIARSGLAARLEDSWLIAGEASSLEEAAALFSRLETWPGLVILDMELSGGWGPDLFALLKGIVKNDPVHAGKKIPPALVYSAYNDYAHINAALRSGAKGYVCKSESVETLLSAMANAAAGNAVIPSALAERLALVSDLVLGLTKREREVFNMVQRGFGNREIAAALGVSIRTIENNLSIIYDKTGAKNRRELEHL